MRQLLASCIVGGFVFSASSIVTAQTSITGGNLVMKSRGAQSGTTLSTTGFLGTYLTVPAGGATLNFTVNAAATAGAAHMNFVVADKKVGFNVTGAATNYTTQNLTLPGGTYLVRAERDYGNGTNQSFSVNNMSVATVSGGAAAFANQANNGSTAAAATANAMAAANTYINNYRKGAMNLAVQGVAPGTAVQVKLKNSAFKWGTAVPDNLTTYLAANPAVGSNAQKYQERLLANFNSITPENAGKWSGSDTAAQLQSTDRMLKYAETNDLRVRQHNLIWGTQQPTRLNTMFTNARSTDPATAAAGKAAIQDAITGRIATYVSGVSSLTGGSTGMPAVIRTTQYADLDVYNESYNTGANTAITTNNNYWKVLGPTESAGAAVTADIYNRVQTAVTNAGANTRLFVNDYNILNNNSDQYGQWFSQHTESIRNAGGQVSGIGVQFYTDAGVSTGGASVDPFRVAQSLANLGTQGLPLELTEFGSRTGADPASALTASMTLAFGSPDMTGFTLWGMYYTGSGMFAGAQGSVLYDANFNITPAGTAYQALRAQWNTDVTTTINADGSVTLPNGAFYGDYDITIKGQHYGLEFDKATNRYLLVILKGDFNNSEVLDAADMDQLFAATPGSTTGAIPAADLRFDVNGDSEVIIAPNVAGSDADYWVHVLKHTEYGDANLDGMVNFADLVTLAQNYNQETGEGWADASFNGDGKVDFGDLVVLAQNYNFGMSQIGTSDTFAADWALAQSLVPEPMTLVIPMLFLKTLSRRRVVALGLSV
jgi:GH35 family endo-1,4-beta-xylanase